MIWKELLLSEHVKNMPHEVLTIAFKQDFDSFTKYLYSLLISISKNFQKESSLDSLAHRCQDLLENYDLDDQLSNLLFVLLMTKN